MLWRHYVTDLARRPELRDGCEPNIPFKSVVLVPNDTDIRVSVAARIELRLDLFYAFLGNVQLFQREPSRHVATIASRDPRAKFSGLGRRARTNRVIKVEQDRRSLRCAGGRGIWPQPNKRSPWA